MTKELEKERTALLQAEESYSNQEKFFTALPARISAAEEKVARLRVDLENARRERPRVVEAIALEKASEADLQKLGEKIFLLQNQLRNAEDVLQQLVQTQTEGRERLIKLSQDVAGKTHSFWNCVSQVELERAMKDSREALTPLVRAWVASNLSGVSMILGLFLSNKVRVHEADVPGTEQIKKELLVEYLGR